MDILVLIVIIATVILVLSRRHLRGRNVQWRSWIGLILGAIVGYTIISLLEPFLINLPEFRMFPAWMWKLGMAIFCGFSCMVPVRKALDEALPPNNKESRDDVGPRR